MRSTLILLKNRFKRNAKGFLQNLRKRFYKIIITTVFITAKKWLCKMQRVFLCGLGAEIYGKGLLKRYEEVREMERFCIPI